MTYNTAEQMYPTDESAILIPMSKNNKFNLCGGGTWGIKGVRMYVAGYTRRTHRKARRAPSFEMNQGIAAGWMSILKKASMKNTRPMSFALYPNPV
jgi:hypothetical protein